MYESVPADAYHCPMLSSNCHYSSGFRTLHGLDIDLWPEKTRNHKEG